MDAGIAVGALADGVAVDEDFAVGLDAVELDFDALAGIGGGQGEEFAELADASGQVGATNAWRRRRR